MLSAPRISAGLALFCIPTFVISAAEASVASAGSLRDLLASAGYAGVKMERQYNTPFIRATINGKPAILVIASNSVTSGIDRGSRTKFGFSERQTRGTVRGTFGLTGEHYGLTQLNRVVIGGASFADFPAAVLNLSNVARGPSIGHADGLIGKAEMRRYGAIIDFAQQMFYMNPTGADSLVTEKVKSLLRNHGFIRIPMIVSPNHFEVPCSINRHSVKMSVDTGAFFTVLDVRTARQTGVSFVPGSIIGGATGGMYQRLNTGVIRDFVVGPCEIRNQNVAVAKVLFDCLGVNYLAVNAAVIDTKGSNLYLRPSG